MFLERARSRRLGRNKIARRRDETNIFTSRKREEEEEEQEEEVYSGCANSRATFRALVRFLLSRQVQYDLIRQHREKRSCDRANPWTAARRLSITQRRIARRGGNIRLVSLRRTFERIFLKDAACYSACIIACMRVHARAQLHAFLPYS